VAECRFARHTACRKKLFHGHTQRLFCGELFEVTAIAGQLAAFVVADMFHGGAEGTMLFLLIAETFEVLRDVPGPGTVGAVDAGEGQAEGVALGGFDLGLL
jgi:hypothetical protein